MAPVGRNLEFGIYRDADNNLDESQGVVLRDAIEATQTDSSIGVYMADTTRQPIGVLHTDMYDIQNGHAEVTRRNALDMANPKTLATFVAQTLDRAEASDAKQTWINLVDHGGGDGGGLETDSTKEIMAMPEMAQAIADGEALHAKEHPEDADRKIDGVVANQCLMSTMAFADALSRVGVKWLAASPETMLSPGTPTSVANAIAKDVGDANAMARDVVDTVMQTKFKTAGESYGPAAAFDVLDLDTTKIANAERAIKALNDTIGVDSKNATMRRAIREDVRDVKGMVRFPEATPDMPWHADRPAIAVYRELASDHRLSSPVRKDAAEAAAAVRDLILAHGEARRFRPFDAGYLDAVGPTIHAPVNAREVDPWAPAISETKNAFYGAVDENKLVRAIA